MRFGRVTRAQGGITRLVPPAMLLAPPSSERAYDAQEGPGVITFDSDRARLDEPWQLVDLRLTVREGAAPRAHEP